MGKKFSRTNANLRTAGRPRTSLFSACKVNNFYVRKRIRIQGSSEIDDCDKKRLSDPYSWEFLVELPRIVFICTIRFNRLFPLSYFSNLLRLLSLHLLTLSISRRALFLYYCHTWISERRMNTSMTHSDAHIYGNDNIRTSHHGLRIRKQVDKSFWCVEDTHYKSFTYFRDSTYR